MARTDYINFMCNPKNEDNCIVCPENRDAAWPEFIKPCGQQNCWVSLHCQDDEEEDDYYV